jgi:hypothetical protein
MSPIPDDGTDDSSSIPGSGDSRYLSRGEIRHLGTAAPALVGRCRPTGEVAWDLPACGRQGLAPGGAIGINILNDLRPGHRGSSPFPPEPTTQETPSCPGRLPPPCERLRRSISISGLPCQSVSSFGNYVRQES